MIAFRKPNLAGTLERVLLTLWVGGMWIVGFLVAPTLFQLLANRSLAGSIAGSLFSAMNYLGLTCGGVLLVLALVHRGRSWLVQWRGWALLAMMALTGLGQFIITPRIQAIRQAQADGPADAAFSHQFAVLHGVSSTLFLLVSVLGLLLVVCGLGLLKADSDR